MQVSCPNCPWKGKAVERPADRWVLCPKCKNRMMVAGTGMIVIPDKAPQIIKIPPAIHAGEYAANDSDDGLYRYQNRSSSRVDPDPEIELETEPEPIIHDPGLIYQGERIRMYSDGRVAFPHWRNRDEAKSLQNEVKLAIEEVKLAMRILKEEQRKTNAKHTTRNRVIGPSLYRYSNKKNTASFLYLAQLVAKAFVSVDSAANTHELEKRREVISMVQFNLEAIDLELRKYLQLNK